jgi:YD repeat-containing protein
MTDADNNETTYSYAYSTSGMVETTTYAPGKTEAGTVTDDYDLAGDLLWETDELGASADDPAHTTNYTYDGLDRLVSMVGPPDSSGQHPETDYLYDPMGDLVQQKQVVERSPLVSEVSTYQYNSLEELALETDPGPNGGPAVTTSFTYTPTGELHTETDARNNNLHRWRVH